MYNALVHCAKTVAFSLHIYKTFHWIDFHIYKLREKLYFPSELRIMWIITEISSKNHKKNLQASNLDIKGIKKL